MTFLVLSDPGSYMGKQKELFKVTFGLSSKPTAYIPANRLEGILIENKTTISSGAFDLLRKYGIPVVWKQYRDDDGLMLLPFNSNGSVEIRREQYLSLLDHRGVLIATAIAYHGSRNKLTLLKRIRRHQSTHSEQVAGYIEKIETILLAFSQENQQYSMLDFECRQTLMNYEAQVAKIYYEALQQLLSVYNWEFDTRSRRPAQDEFNALLNYSYAILKGQMAERIALTGLDIYAGYLHVDRSGRESLLLDIIEEFRQSIDEVLLKLVISKSLQTEMFDREDVGINLNKEVKEILVPALFDKLRQRIRSRKLESWIIYQGRELAKYVRGQAQEYIPFWIKVKDPW